MNEKKLRPLQIKRTTMQWAGCLLLLVGSVAAANKITKFEDLLLSELRSKEKKIIESIAKEQAISETLEKKISDFLHSLSKKFIEDNK